MYFDAEGFEAGYSPAFNGTGELQGQTLVNIDGSTLWKESPNPAGSPSTATVVAGAGVGGSQGVEVVKESGINGFWGATVDALPVPGLPYICIEWDMLVEASMGTPSGGDDPFGPYFGIQAFSEDEGPPGAALPLAFLGVDSQTLDILNISGGVFSETGETVAAGVWNSFQLFLDYDTKTYDGFMNGSALFVDVPFFDTGAELFSDAAIAAIAAADTPYYQGLTGTAYFDNYYVFGTDTAKIPEPAGILLLSVGAALAACRQRR
ncbi:hypothetical protein Pla123a_10870 [Posidoniimonas polymericola]|uniref:PEP-CTERM protein-sorting domain-containing protein n=1 Tax=Posidoniimonas polymericola TaxID=2528002 RepID=A0A5C5YU54_9BACT|nr:hypothetical protein [Posidoniimonas polymericola]TWT78296.1 hypothetical protein Pla123a_10870 [Posidoniimonas polymericola]